MREREWRRDAGAGSGGDEAAESGALDAEPRSVRVRLGVGAAVVLLLGALIVTVVVSAFGQQGTTTAVGPAEPTSAPSEMSTTPPATARELFVHVLGAVGEPGLVTLAPGARVLDAVAAAGGLTADADPAGINLARAVADGEQLAIPRIGEPAPAPAPPAAAASSATNATGATTAVNLNTATQADLETLPRIGPALASRILDWRSANGRFSAPTDLLSVTGIGQKLFDGLKDRVTV